jgi:hypothetical protein
MQVRLRKLLLPTHLLPLRMLRRQAELMLPPVIRQRDRRITPQRILPPLLRELLQGRPSQNPRPGLPFTQRGNRAFLPPL